MFIWFALLSQNRSIKVGSWSSCGVSSDRRKWPTLSIYGSASVALQSGTNSLLKASSSDSPSSTMSTIEYTEVTMGSSYKN